MALFKILQGESSRISTDITPFHEGYAYFTTDDGGFYIDAVVEGENERICINPNSIPIEYTLSKDAWSSKEQTITLGELFSDSNGYTGLSPKASDEAVAAATKAAMRITQQADNALTISCSGEIPTIDIPIIIIILP